MLSSILLAVLAAHAACPVTANKTLYIGDSISLTPYNYSREVTAKIGGAQRFVVGGSAAKNWMNAFKGLKRERAPGTTLCDSQTSVDSLNDIPSVDSLFSGQRPAVVIALGTNDVADFCIAAKQSGLASATRQVLKPAGEFARRASEASKGHCVWLMPIAYTSGAYAQDCSELKSEHASGFAAGIQYLKEAVEKSCTVETTAQCPIPTHFDKIGVHPSSREGAALGACMGAKVAKDLHAAAPASSPSRSRK